MIFVYFNPQKLSALYFQKGVKQNAVFININGTVQRIETGYSTLNRRNLVQVVPGHNPNS